MRVVPDCSIHKSAPDYHLSSLIVFALKQIVNHDSWLHSLGSCHLLAQFLLHPTPEGQVVILPPLAVRAPADDSLQSIDRRIKGLPCANLTTLQLLRIEAFRYLALLLESIGVFMHSFIRLLLPLIWFLPLCSPFFMPFRRNFLVTAQRRLALRLCQLPHVVGHAELLGHCLVVFDRLRSVERLRVVPRKHVWQFLSVSFGSWVHALLTSEIVHRRVAFGVLLFWFGNVCRCLLDEASWVQDYMTAVRGRSAFRRHVLCPFDIIVRGWMLFALPHLFSF